MEGSGGKGEDKHNQAPHSKRKKSFSPSCFFYHLHSAGCHLQLRGRLGVGCGERSAGGGAASSRCRRRHEELPCVIEKKSSEFSLDPHFVITKTMLIPLVHRSGEVCVHSLFFLFSETRRTNRLSCIYPAAVVFIAVGLKKIQVEERKIFSNLIRVALTISVGSNKAEIFF